MAAVAAGGLLLVLALGAGALFYFEVIPWPGAGRVPPRQPETSPPLSGPVDTGRTTRVDPVEPGLAGPVPPPRGGADDASPPERPSPPSTDRRSAGGLPDPSGDGEFAPVAAILADMLRSRQAARVQELTGPDGVTFAPYGTEAEPPGYDNTPELAMELHDAMSGRSVDCVGYLPDAGRLPDKAIVYVRGLAFDWPRLGVEGGSVVTAFHFERDSRAGWRLRFITPLIPGIEPDPELLRPCPR